MLKKSRQKKKHIRWLFETVATLFSVLAVSYFLIVFSLDPNFFKRDFQNKIGQIKGVNIGVIISGDPAKPIVQSESGCDGPAAYVKIYWDADPLASSFKIMRNGELLILGLTETEYIDDALSPGTYQYIVVAMGTNGTEVASDLTEKIIEKCIVPTEDAEVEEEDENPTCKIKTVDSMNVGELGVILRIENQRPVFTGRTNMEKAKIRIEIIGETGILAEIKANKNGFWQWQSPLSLAHGTYEIRVKAIDPNDSSRHKADSLIFKIVKKTEKIEEKTGEIIYSKELPFDFEVEVQNQDKSVYAGEDLNLKTTITKIFKFDSRSEFLKYEVIDAEGNKLIEIYDRISISGNQEVDKKINLSKLLKSGKYKVVAKTSYKNFSIFSEDDFYLKERPIICLSSGRVITLTDILSGLGWLILLILALILIFLLLLILEHRLTKNARMQITEQIFENEGFLGRRKEVDK